MENKVKKWKSFRGCFSSRSGTVASRRHTYRGTGFIRFSAWRLSDSRLFDSRSMYRLSGTSHELARGTRLATDLVTTAGVPWIASVVLESVAPRGIRETGKETDTGATRGVSVFESEKRGFNQLAILIREWTSVNWRLIGEFEYRETSCGGGGNWAENLQNLFVLYKRYTYEFEAYVKIDWIINKEFSKVWEQLLITFSIKDMKNILDC